MRFIGLDVHRDFCEVAICEEGRVRSGPRIATSPEPLARFAESLGPEDEVALECTGNALAVARVLSPHAGRVVIAHAKAVRAIAWAKVKNDRADARTLATLPATGFLPGVAPLDLVATAYPSLKLIIPHLGSFADDWRAHLLLNALLPEHRNIFIDTSAIRRFDYLVEAVRRAGARRVLFGSDGPWLHPGLELAKITALGLGVAERRRVLGDNWLELTGAVRSMIAAGRQPPSTSPDTN